MSDNTNSKGSNSLKIAIVVGIVVIAALLGVIIFLLLGKDKAEEPEKDIRGVVVTKDTVDDVVEEMATAPTVEQGYYEASMTTIWTFATGSDVSEDALVRNVEGNTNDVYFDVVMADDEDNVIYKSPVIPRGSELKEIKLDTPLDAGSYNCVCIYHLIDDEQNTISTLRVGITVVVNK